MCILGILIGASSATITSFTTYFNFGYPPLVFKSPRTTYFRCISFAFTLLSRSVNIYSNIIFDSFLHRSTRPFFKTGPDTVNFRVGNTLSQLITSS